MPVVEIPSSIWELDRIVRERLHGTLPGNVRICVHGDGLITFITDIRIDHDGNFEVIVPYDLPCG